MDQHNQSENLAKLYFETYTKLWDQIIETNQANIKLETDFEIKADLQKQHDLLCSYINKQHDIFVAMYNLSQSMITKREFEYQKQYIRLLRGYIKSLGANPSNVNFNTANDLY